MYLLTNLIVDLLINNTTNPKQTRTTISRGGQYSTSLWRILSPRWAACGKGEREEVGRWWRGREGKMRSCIFLLVRMKEE